MATRATTTSRHISSVRSSAEPLRRYPFVEWRRLKAAWRWQQNQFVLVVGGTGSGKSTVGGEMMPRRNRVVVFVSKGYDEIFDTPYYSEYVRIKKWPPPPRSGDRLLLWPPNGKTIAETRRIKQEVFREAMDDILLHKGYWCIDLDETHYLADSLKLADEITDLEEQGRSFHITLWANTQRPAGIPIAVYVNSTYGLFFLTQEQYDADRLGRMAPPSTNRREMIENIARLTPHEFVFIDKTGKIPPCRSIVDTRRRTEGNNSK